MATAQTMYAIGAAAPSAAAASAGSRKIPPPMVMFTMLAARPQIPSTRMSDDSELWEATVTAKRSRRLEAEQVTSTTFPVASLPPVDPLGGRGFRFAQCPLFLACQYLLPVTCHRISRRRHA